MGRPTKYREAYAEQVTGLCLLGATNEDLARIFEVAPSTIGKWIAEEPEFSVALKAGREGADAQVADSLFQNALGGNVTAQIFWLKNRRPDLWRDKQEHVTKVEYETTREVFMQDGEAITAASAGLPEAGIN